MQVTKSRRPSPKSDKTGTARSYRSVRIFAFVSAVADEIRQHEVLFQPHFA